MVNEVPVFSVWENKMGTKLLFALILYAAGFATAIYVVVPSPARAANAQTSEKDRSSQVSSADIGTQAWAVSVREGMDKAVSFAEEKSLLLAEKIKTHIQQHKSDSGK